MTPTTILEVSPVQDCGRLLCKLISQCCTTTSKYRAAKNKPNITKLARTNYTDMSYDVTAAAFNITTALINH